MQGMDKDNTIKEPENSINMEKRYVYRIKAWNGTIGTA